MPLRRALGRTNGRFTSALAGPGLDGRILEARVAYHGLSVAAARLPAAARMLVAVAHCSGWLPAPPPRCRASAPPAASPALPCPHEEVRPAGEGGPY
jgi:hypothetical protein